jgi:quinol monooxygenase YgiN
MMGRIVIVAYRPKSGKEDALLELTREHHPILLEQNLVTKRKPIIARASDGTIVEVFEWTSKDAMDNAHSNAAVLDLWDRYAKVCDYVKLPDLAESDQLFAEFASVD